LGASSSLRLAQPSCQEALEPYSPSAVLGTTRSCLRNRRYAPGVSHLRQTHEPSRDLFQSPMKISRLTGTSCFRPAPARWRKHPLVLTSPERAIQQGKIPSRSPRPAVELSKALWPFPIQRSAPGSTPPIGVRSGYQPAQSKPH